MENIGFFKRNDKLATFFKPIIGERQKKNIHAFYVLKSNEGEEEQNEKKTKLTEKYYVNKSEAQKGKRA